MSKQYLMLHQIEEAHRFDIFSLAVASGQIISGSGASALRIHSTIKDDFPLNQELVGAHTLGCHHVVTCEDGVVAASVGFGGECKIWRLSEGSQWAAAGQVEDGLKGKCGEIWAPALSKDGQYLASTTADGRINVWDLLAHDEQKIREYTTKGSFGLSVDLSKDGKFTASGHQNGGVYIFDNDTNRMAHSLVGIVNPVRTVAFSPASKLLAAAGDSGVITLFDVASGDQIAALDGHDSWVSSLDWNHTGEYLLSGSYDGKVKVWSVELRHCVATHSETITAIHSVKWLPKVGKNEGFATAGANRSVAIYREATGV